MSKQEEAGLILKLYELRRETTLREARNWYFRDFNPQTIAEFGDAMMGPNGAYVRMVLSYWDMAAALVNDGAISYEMFDNANGEHYGTFLKIEKLLPEIRSSFGPKFASQLEKLIDATPDGRKRLDFTRERMAAMRARMESAKAQSQASQAKSAN